MSGTMRLVCVIVVMLFESTVLVGCGGEMNAGMPGATPGRAAAPSAASSGVPFASLKELMDSTVDPAADGLWDAVAVTSTSAGIERHEPRTPEEWAAVRRHAITLIEAMNLVVMPGRRAAPVGAQPGLGELPPQQIEHLIEQQRPVFTAFATGLRETARQALAAIDRKDPDALLNAGGDIDAACEACHVTFWYPNQQYTK
jgi:cytochrome c556